MNRELEHALRVMNEMHPEDKDIEHWSGCNYYINQGKYDTEPLGTATAMHDCGNCEKVPFCLVKQPTRIFEMSNDIQKDLDMKWVLMRRGIQ